MKPYRIGFEKMAERIKNDAGRNLIEVSFGGPPDEASLEKFYDLLDVPGSDAVLQFYEEMDGVQIIWNNAGKAPAATEFPPTLFLNSDAAFDGVINFLPLKTMLDPDVWEGKVWYDNAPTKMVEFIGEKMPEAEIRKRLLPFDLFSFSESVAWYAGAKNACVLLLQDYHVDYRDSRLTRFEDYVEFVLATDGLTKARYKALNELDGFRKPVVTAAQLLEAL